MATKEQIKGIQLTGRHAWPDEQTNAARAYARESTLEKREVLSTMQSNAAKVLQKLQVKLGFSYVTDGGFRLEDDFVPYIEHVNGVSGAQGQINRQPGTINQYYFIPLVKEKLEPAPPFLESYIAPRSAVMPETKEKLILISPLSFALAAEFDPERPAYKDRTALMLDFARVQGEALRSVAGNYNYVQLNESFATDERFHERVTRAMLTAFREALDSIFSGFPQRSAVYFSSGDASGIIPAVLESKVTDIGFDFNTSASSLSATISKNIILGLQNVTRKLPKSLLRSEPGRLAQKATEAISQLNLSSSAEIFLAQSQGSDGLQTYPQALTRDRNLSAAFELIRSESI